MNLYSNARFYTKMKSQLSRAGVSPIQCIWPGAEIVSIDGSDSDLLHGFETDLARIAVLCAFVRARDEKILRKALARASFSRFSSYALVPDHNAPRWLIPLGSGRVASASLRLYNPQTLKGKGGKWLISNMARFGILRVFRKDRLLIASKSNAQNKFLASFLMDLLGIGDIRLALSMGTEGYYRKMTVQVMSEDGQVFAYAKIADTRQARKILIQEAKTLRCLAELRISSGYVPQLIYSGRFCKSELLVQSVPLVKTRKGPKQLDRRHVEFLAEIFNRTSKREPILESNYWFCIKKDIESLHEKTSDDWRRRLRNGLDICESTVGNEIVPLGLCHRDFVPWNTYLERGRLYVFDWEYTLEQGIPFWDLFHFVSLPAALVQGLDGKQVIDLWQRRNFKRLLIQYVEKIGVDLEFASICFLLYLIEVSCFYLDMFARDGLRNAQRQRLQKTWAEMLDELTIHWEQYQNQWL